MAVLLQKLLSPENEVRAIVELPDFNLVDANQAFIRHFELSPTEVKGADFFSLFGRRPSQKVITSVVKGLAEHMISVQELGPEKEIAEFQLVQWQERRLVLCRLHVKKPASGNTAVHHRYRTVPEVSLESVVYLKDGMITDCNDQFVNLFGYTGKQEVIRRELSDFFTPQDIKRVDARIEISNTNKMELRTFDRIGRPVYVEVTGSYLENGDGKSKVYVLIDVTSRKKAEQALEQSVLRFRNLLENSPNAVVILTEGRVRYVNSAAVSLLGCDDEDDLYDKDFIDFIPAASREIVENDLRQIRQGADVPYREINMIDNRGSEIGVGIKSSLTVYDNKPSIQVTLNNISLRMQLVHEQMRAELAEELNSVLKREIKEHTKTQKKLSEQKAKLESIFNSTENLMMITFDKRFAVTGMNNNFRIFMRDSLNEQLGLGDEVYNKLYAHRHPDHYQGQLEAFKRAFEGRPQQVEIPISGIRGELLWLQAFLNPVNTGEDLEEVSCLMYDTTERKEIDKRVRDSLKEKEILLQEVHHRVKNNLQVISSILSLQSNYVNDQRTREILWESQQRIKSMSFVHETLYRTADFTSIDFQEYLRTLSSNLLHSYKPSDVEVDFQQNIDAITMPIDQAIPCGLIVNELISNSLKYAFTGRKKGRLELCLKDEGDKICLRVTDDGVGLPDNFKYEENESLGIQLVYTLSEQLDAKLLIESKKGAGTTFRITFGKE